MAHAIVDGGLESYYRYRTELPERPDERQAAKRILGRYLTTLAYSRSLFIRMAMRATLGQRLP